MLVTLWRSFHRILEPLCKTTSHSFLSGSKMSLKCSFMYLLSVRAAAVVVTLYLSLALQGDGLLCAWHLVIWNLIFLTLDWMCLFYVALFKWINILNSVYICSFFFPNCLDGVPQGSVFRFPWLIDFNVLNLWVWRNKEGKTNTRDNWNINLNISWCSLIPNLLYVSCLWGITVQLQSQ